MLFQHSTRDECYHSFVACLQGCKLRLQDMDGRAALHMAASKGEIKVVEALMVSDLNPSYRQA